MDTFYVLIIFGFHTTKVKNEALIKSHICRSQPAFLDIVLLNYINLPKIYRSYIHTRFAVSISKYSYSKPGEGENKIIRAKIFTFCEIIRKGL